MTDIVSDAGETPKTYPQLSKPPLREALIDIQLAAPLPQPFVQKLDVQTLGGHMRVGDIKEGTLAVKLGSEGHARTSLATAETIGARFDNAERSQAVQFRRNGMTFSVLKNYRNWTSFRAEAQELWNAFLKLAEHVSVNRLAVRYVNAINLPLGEDSDNYLGAGPRIPSQLPQVFNGFFTRIVVPLPNLFGHVIITQASEPVTDTGFPTILDIYAVSESSFDGADANLWARLDQLRAIKNRAFFSSLTPRALDLYR